MIPAVPSKQSLAPLVDGDVHIAQVAATTPGSATPSPTPSPTVPANAGPAISAPHSKGVSSHRDPVRSADAILALFKRAGRESDFDAVHDSMTVDQRVDFHERGMRLSAFAARLRRAYNAKYTPKAAAHDIEEQELASIVRTMTPVEKQRYEGGGMSRAEFTFIETRDETEKTAFHGSSRFP